MYLGHVVKFHCRNEIGLVGPFVNVSLWLFKDIVLLMVTPRSP